MTLGFFDCIDTLESYVQIGAIERLTYNWEERTISFYDCESSSDEMMEGLWDYLMSFVLPSHDYCSHCYELFDRTVYEMDNFVVYEYE